MARPSPYTPEQKTAILEAVKTARKSGKKWPEALEAAKAEGYKGELQYLMKMARNAGAVKPRKKSKPAKAPKAAGPGRPKGSTNAAKRGPGRPKGKPGRPKGTAAGKGAGLSDIDRIVAQMVEQRLGVALAKAVAALEDAAQELKSL